MKLPGAALLLAVTSVYAEEAPSFRLEEVSFSEQYSATAVFAPQSVSPFSLAIGLHAVPARRTRVEYRAIPGSGNSFGAPTNLDGPGPGYRQQRNLDLFSGRTT